MKASYCGQCGSPLPAGNPQQCPVCRADVSEQRKVTDYGSPPHGVPRSGLDPNAPTLPSPSPPPGPTGPHPPVGILGGTIIVVIALLLILGGIGAFTFLRGSGGVPANATATAQVQLNAVATARAQLNATATAQAQAPASATAVIQAQLNATATALALTPTPLSITITSPKEGSSVPLEILVEGTASGIPQDEELWLLVVAGGVTGYYPQNGPIVASADGKWSATALLGGQGTNDVGRAFVLYTALANQEGKAAIQAYFQQAPNFKPLDPLPAGIMLISQVRVVRA